MPRCLGCASSAPGRHTPDPQSNDNPPHSGDPRRQQQRSGSHPPGPAIPPGLARVDRYRLSHWRRPQREHLRAAKPRARRRHCNELRPDRPLPHRLRRKFRRRTGDGRTAHRSRSCMCLGRSALSISPDTLSGHRDFAATSCPGANLYAHIASGDIKRRIEDLEATGAGDLQRVCGPEAAARVAAIEAGN